MLIKQKLSHILGLSSTHSIFARNCKVGKVASDDKACFFKTSHIQGNGPSSINLGLYNSGVLVACIGLIQKTNRIYIINRYATSINVVGGFTKLLSHFKRHFDWNKIETFADLRWSEGKLYQQTGFTEEYVIPPDYYWTNGTHKWHKAGFRHKLLANKLEKYDPSLTEEVNCKTHGLYKIYDCGKAKYILSNNS